MIKPKISLKKGILLLGLCLFAFATGTFAQSSITDAEYKQYINSQIELEFRKASYEAAELNREEIIAFDAFFPQYMAEKEFLLEKKVDLLREYNAEMREDDSEKNHAEDRADFVEDFWEVEIDEMQLSKRYFDILEDKVAVNKVIKFFLYENAVENRIKNNVVRDLIPSVGNLDKVADQAIAANTKSTNKELAKMTANGLEKNSKDYRRYIESKIKLDFRNESIKVLDLNKEEIIAFDPIFRNYMIEREMLLEQKMNLLDDIREELKEDDSPKNEEEDIADFIEDYWEVEIDEMQLRKNYFDILEDKIPANKAIKFFLWEDAVQNRVKRNVLESMMPSMIILKKLPNKHAALDKKTKKSLGETRGQVPTTIILDTVAIEVFVFSDSTIEYVEKFNQWVRKNRGDVDLSHDYTSTGLKALLDAMEALKSDLAVEINDFDRHREVILDVSNEITIDPMKTNHADKTRKAFMKSALILEEMNPNSLGELNAIANDLDPDKLMTHQAATIYKFFDEASEELREITKKRTVSNSK